MKKKHASPGKQRSETRFSTCRQVLVCMLLLLSILSVYWQTRHHHFVNYDDNRYVTDNRHVRAGLTLDGIVWAFTTNHASNWHPVTWLSHMLDVELYGIDPGRHHVTNLLFHIANTLLLFFVFGKMSGLLWQSAFVAFLFALHPLHVESVAWIAERKDVLSTFFWMLTMGSYVRYVRNRKFYNYLLMIFFFILGLMSKPMVVTLPFVLLLLDHYPLSRFSGSTDGDTAGRWPVAFRLILEKSPLFFLAAVSSILTIHAQSHGGTVASLDVIPIQTRIANAPVLYVSYIFKAIYPVNLTVLYRHPGSFPWWQVGGAGLLLLSISFWAIRVARRNPYVVVGWLWFLGTLVPVIGLVQVGSQSVADRYTYIPLIGIFIIVSWGVSDISRRWRPLKKLLPVISTAVLLIFLSISLVQVGYWKNSITLFEHALEVDNNSDLAHNNLAIALQVQGRMADAVRHYREALRVNPDYGEAHYNLAIVLQAQDHLDDAIQHYEAALRIKPDFEEAHNNLAIALFDKGDIQGAIDHFQEALNINPDYVTARENLDSTLKYRHGR